jgi:hypothetical protein
MLHCYNCGADMPDNMLYCTRCGKKLDATETQTQVFGDGAAPTVAFGGPTRPVTQPMVVKKRGGGLKAFLIVLVSLLVLGGIGVVAAAMFWTYSKRQAVVVNANIQKPSNIPEIPNINGITANANTAIDDAIKQIQKAANDALAAANQASNLNISTGKKLDGQTNRIAFRPGATSAVTVGTIEDEATFVLRAKAGQKLTGKIVAPGGCVKFEDEDSNLTLETDDGDNYLTVVNGCGKPTSMVLTVTIK